MTTYPTPNSIRAGETKPFPYDWSARLLEIGATSLVSSAWDVESGGVTLENDSLGAVTSATNLTGAPTTDTDSVISNSVVTNTGAKLVERFHVFTTVGVFITPLSYYHGVGVAGLSDVTTLTSSGTRSFTSSPSNRKVYFAGPVAEGIPTITLDDWLVDLLEPTIVTVGAVDYYLLETENLLTGANLPFVVSA